jgi:superoxide dismutase, Cu-Zn family
MNGGQMMKTFAFLCGIFALAALSYSEDMTVTVHLVSADGVGKQIGTITLKDTKYGLLLNPDLSDLPPGLHGFHVHEHASCTPAEKEGKMTAAHSAGSHFDPDKSSKHMGPYANGHLGDLPPLFVDANGKSTLPVLAPRLKSADLAGHALMIHQGGDNYRDQPDPLGGGGARIACGVVK